MSIILGTPNTKVVCLENIFTIPDLPQSFENLETSSVISVSNLSVLIFIVS